MTAPDLPPAVAEAYAAMPEPTRRAALAIRGLILGEAAAQGVTRLEEALRWGEPAFLPGRGGTTIRIGWDRESGDCKLLVHCQTSLVETWRDRFGDALTFEGNRAVRIDPAAMPDETHLAQCIADALTYHTARRSRHG